MENLKFTFKKCADWIRKRRKTHVHVLSKLLRLRLIMNTTPPVQIRTCASSVDAIFKHISFLQNHNNTDRLTIRAGTGPIKYARTWVQGLQQCAGRSGADRRPRRSRPDRANLMVSTGDGNARCCQLHPYGADEAEAVDAVQW